MLTPDEITTLLEELDRLAASNDRRGQWWGTRASLRAKHTIIDQQLRIKELETRLRRGRTIAKLR